MNEQRNDFLDILKGSLITLVCIGHANQYVVHQNSGFFYDPLFKAIYMFHMPLFMAVAGYLSYSGITRTNGGIAYVSRRVIALLIPIFVWTLIEHSWRHFLLGKPVTVAVIMGYTGLDRLWFLWVLIESIVLMAVAVKCGRYRIIVLFMFFAGMFYLPDTSHFYLLKYVYPFFLAGYFCAGIDFPRVFHVNIAWIVLPLGVASIICFLIWNQQTYIYISQMALTRENVGNILFRWLAGVIVSLFFLFFLFFVHRFLSGNVKKLLIWAGQDSIYIYIFQTYVFIFLFSMAARFFDPVTNRPLGTLLSITIGCVVTLFCLGAGRLVAKRRVVDMVLFGKIRHNTLSGPETNGSVSKS